MPDLVDAYLRRYLQPHGHLATHFSKTPKIGTISEKASLVAYNLDHSNSPLSLLN